MRSPAWRTSLSLRRRLVVGLVVVGALQALAAIVTVSVVYDNMLGDVDEELRALSTLRQTPDRDEPSHVEPDHHDGASSDGRQGPERFSTVYEGILDADGSLTDKFVPYTSRGKRSAPELEPDQATKLLSTQRRSLFTAEAEDHGGDYRVLAEPQGNGTVVITAIGIDGLQRSIRGLASIALGSSILIALCLLVIGWWVIRLGIRPIAQMTATAKAIAAGDLHARVDTLPEGTEAGAMGSSLNTMVSQLQNTLDEKTAAEQRLRDFLADASHELRTPVATISGYAELYRMGGLTDRADLDDAMRRTEQESQRMGRLVNDMLQLTRLDEGVVALDQSVGLGTVVADCVADARVRQRERVLIFEPDKNPIVVGNEDLIRQAVGNVLTNALVHTPTDARVTVTVRTSDNAAEVVVADEGPGMAEDTAQRMKERFVRADASRTRSSGGSGLGLSIADEALRSHGGSLEIESAPGVGTTVRLLFTALPPAG